MPGGYRDVMRGLRHTFERALPLEELADGCLGRLESARPGTRLWVCDQLGVLRLQRIRAAPNHRTI